MDFFANIMKSNYDITLIDAQKNSIKDLNQFPSSLILQAKTITDEADRMMFLKYYTAPSEHQYLGSFEQRVVSGSQDAFSWKTARILIPYTSLEEQVKMSSTDLPILEHEGELMKIKPDKNNWLSATATCGAPALVQKKVNYKTPVPKQTIDLAFRPERLEPVANLRIAVSRWIAQRLARCMWTDGQFVLSNIQKYTRRKEQRWSKEALAGYNGLLKEMRYFQYGPDDVPGFKAPDDWFSL